MEDKEITLVSAYRTHTCGELTEAHVGQQVSLSGWVMRKRDHGGVVFVDLRDHYGVTQVVFSDEKRELVQNTRIESVIKIVGEVILRSPELVNPKMSTGKVEVVCKEFEILSAADVLPFQIAEDDKAPESQRLKARFLELRRDKLHKNILLRTQVISELRNLMNQVGFMEFHTPILTSSSPEGARDFIVPSRLHPGKFFALPQAPQQFKQLLMVSGFDRYFQIAPCFRDEDARADRSPGEFYQLDMELSFVEQDDVFSVNEFVFSRLFKQFSDLKVPDLPFKRLTYAESMSRYGTDKPDLRNSLEIVDVSEVFANTEFKVFRNIVEQDRSGVYAIKVDVDKVPPRKFFDDLIADFKKKNGQGLAYLVCEEGSQKGPVAKFSSESEIESLKSLLKVEGLAVVFFAAGKTKQTLSQLAPLRNFLGTEFNCVDKSSWEFCWIVDYPMYELDDATGKLEFSHNPFSMPQGGLEALSAQDPLEIVGYQYDMVLNGHELASGAIRNHDPEIMYKAFELVGHSKEDVDKNFGGMIRAFRYGAPPHGGAAFGIERIVMLLAGEEAIREVIPFPLAQTGEDLLMGAPSEVSSQQLKDVHITLDLPPDTSIK